MENRALIDELTTELIGCMNQSDNYMGVHTRVNSLKIFSPSYLFKIRNGERKFKDKPETINRVRKIVKAYETELFKTKKRINKIEVTI